jgi:bacterial/archaeal transporter family-2 protein
MTRPEATTYWLLLTAGLIAGGLLPTQAGVNARLGRGLGHPVQGALASFLIGTAALLAASLALRLPWPTIAGLKAVPWWAWLGGLLGTVYVVATIVLAPRLGAATLVGVLVAGQMLASLALDHFGWVGFPQRPVDLPRLAGAALLVAGVYLIQRP